MASFREQVRSFWPELSEESTAAIVRFYELLVDENERQNLTRLTEPTAFIEGHLWDVKELLGMGCVDFPALDLGSGCGVPGLLAACIRPDAWVLAESEKNKAEFLFRASRELRLSQTKVIADRGEHYLKDRAVSSLVVRAVGPLDRIYSWLRHCSTWNNLILLKGPKWEEEWEGFKNSKFRGELEVAQIHRYEAGVEKKSRIIVKLERVPRGTSQKQHSLQN